MTSSHGRLPTIISGGGGVRLEAEVTASGSVIGNKHYMTIVKQTSNISCFRGVFLEWSQTGGESVWRGVCVEGSVWRGLCGGGSGQVVQA